MTNEKKIGSVYLNVLAKMKFGEYMATIREIAELAQVSVGTVSFVLNGKSEKMRISQATQKRVLEAAKELGYRPSLSARRLRSTEDKEIPVIAILWTLDARTSLISRFLQGIQQKSLLKDGLFELVIQPYENGKLNEEESLLLGTRYNGAIIANASDKDLEYIENNDFNVPIVIYQRQSDKYSTVYVDSKKTGSMIAEKFILNGHSKIGLIIPTLSSQAVDLRTIGFKEKLSEHNLYVESSYELYEDYSEEGGYRAVKRLIKENKQLPTAIFFLSDQMALGGIKAFNNAGIIIPNQVEIIGHDNEDFTRFTSPSLSTVHLPVEEMAESCVRLLLEIIKHKVSSSESVKFKSYLVERSSSL